MAILDHNRLDCILTTRQYTDAPCGSLNKETREAAYCSNGCPTLKARILADEPTETPINTWPPPPVDLPLSDAQPGDAIYPVIKPPSVAVPA